LSRRLVLALGGATVALLVIGAAAFLTLGPRPLPPAGGVAGREGAAPLFLSRDMTASACLRGYAVQRLGRASDGRTVYGLTLRLAFGPQGPTDFAARISAPTCSRDIDSAIQMARAAVGGRTDFGGLRVSYQAPYGERIVLP
jgi:hypothetical protein